MPKQGRDKPAHDAENQKGGANEKSDCVFFGIALQTGFQHRLIGMVGVHTQTVTDAPTG